MCYSSSKTPQILTITCIYIFLCFVINFSSDIIIILVALIERSPGSVVKPIVPVPPYVTESHHLLGIQLFPAKYIAWPKLPLPQVLKLVQDLVSLFLLLHLCISKKWFLKQSWFWNSQKFLQLAHMTFYRPLLLKLPPSVLLHYI